MDTHEALAKEPGLKSRARRMENVGPGVGPYRLSVRSPEAVLTRAGDGLQVAAFIAETYSQLIHLDNGYFVV